MAAGMYAMHAAMRACGHEGMRASCTRLPRLGSGGRHIAGHGEWVGLGMATGGRGWVRGGGPRSLSEPCATM